MGDKQAATVEIRREYADRPAAAEIVNRNVQALRATVLGLSRVRKLRKQGGVEPAPTASGASSGEVKEREVDQLVLLEREGKVVSPPFDLLTLAVMPENNTELGPAIDAMAVNVESFGWRLDPRVPLDENTPPEILATLVQEQTDAENFFENCSHDGESLEELRDKLRRDLEATGNFYVEFVERPGTAELDALNHLPAWTVRISRMDEDLTEYIDPQIQKSVRLVELPPEMPEEEPGEPGAPEPSGGSLEDAPDLAPAGEAAPRERADRDHLIRKEVVLQEQVSYTLREVTRFKRFRRYVQVVNGTKVWFKELGDPRLISSKDGRVITREDLQKDHGVTDSMPRWVLEGDRTAIRTGTTGWPVAWTANPVRHKRLYSTRSPYGLPRYIGHLFCIFGSRAAEEINFTTFKNNNVPSMAITVSNGKLDDDSVERIEEFVEAAIQGDDNYSKFLLLEAEPVMEGMRDPGTVKIEITPLTREQHSDALFVNYKAGNDESVRRAWRFPPIFVGKSEDFTGKTIEASRKLADEQVFAPERARMDRFFTKDVLIRFLRLVWSVFRSLSPNVTENADMVRLLAQGEKTGGLTPRIARKLIGRVVNEDLGDVDPDLVPPDQPFSLTLAQVMKSNSASAAAGGGEPTSQGRAGLQVAGPERDRTAEPSFPDVQEDDVERSEEDAATDALAELIRAEVAERFGGWLPPSFEE